MALNTISGRSFNDLSQYPVFPHVLADYTSTELDLGRESIMIILQQKYFFILIVFIFQVRLEICQNQWEHCTQEG